MSSFHTWSISCLAYVYDHPTVCRTAQTWVPSRPDPAQSLWTAWSCTPRKALASRRIESPDVRGHHARHSLRRMLAESSWYRRILYARVEALWGRSLPWENTPRSRRMACDRLWQGRPEWIATCFHWTCGTRPRLEGWTWWDRCRFRRSRPWMCALLSLAPSGCQATSAVRSAFDLESQ